MAIPWLTVLQSVPWGEVIRRAPAVAEGAKKLWNSVGRRSATGPVEAPAPAADPKARLAAAEAAITELQAQMLASSELIKSLAEQNAELIRRAETNRMRTLWLAAATALVGVLALLGWVR